jgi:hypothetical protein
VATASYLPPPAPPAHVNPFLEILRGALMQRFLLVHTWEGKTYFNRERFESALGVLVVIGDMTEVDAARIAGVAMRTGYDFNAFRSRIGTGQMSMDASSFT